MHSAPKLHFLGATGTVTGSCYLLESAGRRVLVDSGLFQGYKQLRLRNWAPPPFDPRDIDAVILTHAHIDHSGYLPLLVRRGFRGPIYGSAGTVDLCRILLPDSAHLQEEEAEFANRRGFSRHKPALPLYTREDAQHCLERLRAVRVGAAFGPAPGISATLRLAGHILGATSVHIQCAGVSVTFSGDLGRSQDPLMQPPARPGATDYLVVESTYGDRHHPPVDPEGELLQWLGPACARGAVTVLPAFAVGRAQMLLLCIGRLKASGRLPDVPVCLDSPMASDVTALYERHAGEHRLSRPEVRALCQVARIVNTAEDSRELDRRGGPMIIVSASGMATGGRVIHHLRHFAPDPRNLVLLAGFQAPGTRGASLAAGAKQVRIHGEEVPVRAQVGQLAGFSAHADADELMAWMRSLPAPPRLTFITHGEPPASDALRWRIEHELRWPVMVPEHRAMIELNGSG